ncbi:hypothetical protein T4D_14887 [Trichinella pseudospiralis]|uniref:Uncharacterized protein n=1 Tax=Trichinella pseudospiralis TaxID=6337 RepID=A0A0V1DMY5_TRIPS|nr:hypothetical protein T4D_14887 [Trichinella pseudospiralis]
MHLTLKRLEAPESLEVWWSGGQEYRGGIGCGSVEGWTRRGIKSGVLNE